MTWGIQFTRMVRIGMTEQYWLLNPMTGKPKEWDEKREAARYAKLSLFVDFKILKLKK